MILRREVRAVVVHLGLVMVFLIVHSIVTQLLPSVSEEKLLAKLDLLLDLRLGVAVELILGVVPDAFALLVLSILNFKARIVVHPSADHVLLLNLLHESYRRVVIFQGWKVHSAC